MFAVPLPQLDPPTHEAVGLDPAQGGYPFTLITARAYGQHNTYKEADPYRGMPHRHCLMMNAEDAKRTGLQEHQRVWVQGLAYLEGIEILFGPIKPGSVLMFYPEASHLIRLPRIPRQIFPPLSDPLWRFFQSVKPEKSC
ncbi:MAG: molybdopterin dinucleotide binding domain-containing protein [Cyanobacteriota bacterium]